MRRRVVLFGVPLGVAIVVLSFVSGLDSSDSKENTDSNRQRVEVSVAKEVPDTLSETFTGTVVAEDRGPVSFTRGGRIEELFVSTGDRVSRGELLARLDERPYRNALEQARATLSRVESSLQQAERNLERVEGLGEAATEEELEERTTAVETLRAQRREAGVAVSEAERRVEEASLTAPFDGEVVAQLAERGEVVQAGSPLYLLSGAGKQLEVELSLPERLYSTVDVEAPTTLHFPLSPDIPSVDGSISSLADHAGGSGGLFTLTLRLAESALDAGVRPGMRAKVALPTLLPAGTISVDPAAVVSRPDGTPVLYLVEGDRVRQVAVELHRVYEKSLLLGGPLEAGALIVVSGQGSLLEGERVEVVKR